MIDNREEYRSMFEVEQKLWWYQVLHGRVLAQIEKHFERKSKQIKILDAACGTGGLMYFLQEKGYQICGFDYSQHAIDFSKERKLDVDFGDLRHVDNFRPNETYDVICCNDALYFLSNEEIVNALNSFKARLNPSGLMLINIHAFEAFSGTHDVAVGSSRRFVLDDFVRYAAAAGLKISYHTYWPFLLSLPIWLVRKWQRYQMRTGKISELHSDVSYPGNFVNGLLKAITAFENSILPSAPFGSSLFLVLR